MSGSSSGTHGFIARTSAFLCKRTDGRHVRRFFVRSRPTRELAGHQDLTTTPTKGQTRRTVRGKRTLVMGNQAVVWPAIARNLMKMRIPWTQIVMWVGGFLSTALLLGSAGVSADEIRVM